MGSNCRLPRRRWGRTAITSRKLLIAIVVVLALPAIVWSMFPGLPWSSEEAMPRMQPVERAEFIHEVTERGNVESASNIEIRCQVQSQNTAGTRILEIIAEGTYVQKGEILVKLDSSALETDMLKQEIVCKNSEALLAQAEKEHELAKESLKEYSEGKYKLDLEKILADLAVANEYFRRAKDYLRYSEELYGKGYVTKLQFEADKFAVTKAEKDMAVADLNKIVLEKYTKKKMDLQLQSDIKTTLAKFQAQKATHDLDTERLAFVKGQVEKCIIRAPEPGQVVYANNNDHHYGNEVLIEEGALVRERQVIVRLPDPKRMQVKAKINEAKIALVKAEMPVTIRLDAFPDLELQGSVKKVSEYPAPAAWFASNIKEYETVIQIPGSSVELRPGLTAEVKIRVDRQTDVLQLPVQAVFQYGAKHFTVVRDGPHWVAQEVEIGASNDKVVVIRDGLDEGQRVVLNSAAYREKVALPELPRETDARTMLAGGRPQDTVRQPGKGSAGAAAAGGSKAGPQTVAVADRAAKPKDKDPDPSADVTPSFEQLDKNRSGFLEKDEIPETLKARLAAADTNRDGRIDRSELAAALGRRTASDSKAKSGRGGPL